MRLEPTGLPGVLLVEPQVFTDDRGWFMETFHAPRWQDAMAALGLPPPGPFLQDSQSCSRAGVLRGLHYQLPPHAQGKLVRVCRGAAFDVAVDIRRGSPQFGRWFGCELSAANRRQLWIPPGFAHGFLALEDDTLFLYKTTAVYAPASERSMRWDDPAIGIRWPLARRDGRAVAPIVAPKDAAAPLLAAADLPDLEEAPPRAAPGSPA